MRHAMRNRLESDDGRLVVMRSLAVLAALTAAAVALAADTPATPEAASPPASAAPAQQKKSAAIGYRRHSLLQDGKGRVSHEITEIFNLTDEEDQTTVLVLDRDHGRYILERNASYREHITSFRIADAKQRAFVKASFVMPYVAKTRREAIREMQNSPALANAPVVLTLSTNGGEWKSLTSDFTDWPDARRIRGQVRPTVDTFLLEALERMREAFFATAVGASYYEFIGRYVLYGTANAQGDLMLVPAQPDCGFDESFGFACSDAQKKKIAAAENEGKTLPHY